MIPDFWLGFVTGGVVFALVLRAAGWLISPAPEDEDYR